MAHTFYPKDSYDAMMCDQFPRLCGNAIMRRRFFATEFKELEPDFGSASAAEAKWRRRLTARQLKDVHRVLSKQQPARQLGKIQRRLLGAYQWMAAEDAMERAYGHP